MPGSSHAAPARRSPAARTLTPSPIATHSTDCSRHRASTRIPPSFRSVDVEIVRPLEPDWLRREAIERFGRGQSNAQGQNSEARGVGRALDQREPETGAGGRLPALPAPSAAGGLFVGDHQRARRRALGRESMRDVERRCRRFEKLHSREVEQPLDARWRSLRRSSTSSIRARISPPAPRFQGQPIKREDAVAVLGDESHEDGDREPPADRRRDHARHQLVRESALLQAPSVLPSRPRRRLSACS